MPPPTWRSWRAGALVFSLWTLVSLLSVGGLWVSSWGAGTPPPDLHDLLWSLQSDWLWALMTPFMFACCDRYPLVRPSRWRNLGVHLLLLAVLWVITATMRYVLAPWLSQPTYPFVAQLARSLVLSIFCYFVGAGVGHALRFHRLYMERRLRASELETQLLRAQFLALQMQLRPHFLFNSLNTITGLIRTGDSRGAVQMTAGLADLLRAVLRSDGSQEVPLRQELDFVERYLRIEQLRFQERLRIDIQVDPEAADALVPHLLLQPLVENAVRHGVRSDTTESRVEIQITREEDELWLRVRDTGEGPLSPPAAAPEPGVPEEGGIGLSNTRARLRHLYGDAQRLELLPAEGGGALAQAVIPFRRVEVTP
ncbi:sensor histidine kinase [Hyalangium versicolor]|uniref:sensor histidine kinase n=1 Tax=Hyalangium versicolor TaxID=2861190 RepID=UPI001CCDECF3|nr:sensor histidine kinase [Hyalangium versicolor]